MSTATIRIGSVMARQMRSEHFAQSNPGAIALKQTTERELPGGHAHEDWMRSVEEAWQGHLETLQQQVCELLLRNQQLRMALNAANEPKQGYKNAGNF
jgi:hypothetical protein